jgi:hypothetical protein
VSTTCDVNVVGPTVSSIGGKRAMEGVLTTLDNKNDWGSLVCLPVSPLCGSNSTVAPHGSKGLSNASRHCNGCPNLCYTSHIREIISPIRCGSFAS